MQARPLGSYVRIIGLATVLATRSFGAQEAPLPRFGLGATALVAALTSGSGSVYAGAEGFVRLASNAFLGARIDGALYSAVGSPFVSGCLLSATADGVTPCDQRRIGSIGTVMATVLAGPRLSSGIRPFYFLLGAGGAVTTWGGGSYTSGRGTVKHAVGLGPTVAIVQGGFGSEFYLFGADRIELRLHLSSPATSDPIYGQTGPQYGGGMSLTLGHMW